MTVNPTAPVETAAATTDGGDSYAPSENIGQQTSYLTPQDYANGLRSLIRANEKLSTGIPGLDNVSFFDSADNNRIRLAHNPTGPVTDAGTTLQTGERSTEWTPRNAAERQILDRMQRLESRYNISITRPGQFLGNQDNLCLQPGEKPAPNPSDSTAIHSRLPTARELTALENALKATGDSARTRDGQKLKVTFVDKGTEIGQGGNTGTEGAHYLSARDNNGVPELRINPTGKLPTHALEHVLRHEIGHNAEFNAYTDGNHPPEFYERLGFTRVTNQFRTGAPGEPQHLDAIQMRDGSLYVKLPPSCKNMDGSWALVNKDGHMIDARGNVVPLVNGEPDPNSAVKPLMRDDGFIERNWRVRQPTPYFDNVNETVTDAYATWSGLTGSARANFERTFPHHFAAIQRMLTAQRANLPR